MSHTNDPRTFGKKGPTVFPLALGCMGMSEFYGERDDVESVLTLERALERGVNHWDTADMYGPYLNEELLGKFFAEGAGRREKVHLASKFGLVRDASDPTKRGVDSSPDYLRKACDASLLRLRTDHIDLYYAHRINPKVPVEDTVGALADLVKEGKIRAIGLSEVSAKTIRRASRIHAIAAVQSEYSLFSRDVEEDVIPTCKELGITFVAYSPLGRGLLTGHLNKSTTLAPTDYRGSLPRLQGENFDKNLAIVAHLQAVADAKKCTPAQLALAWVLAQGTHVLPLFGTKKRKYLDENLAALDVEFSADELAQIERIAPRGAAAGDRYSPVGMSFLNT